MIEDIPSEEYLRRLNALEGTLKGLEPGLTFQRGPNNESLTAIGRIDRPAGDKVHISCYAEQVSIIVTNMSRHGRATYFSTGCNVNAATYAVTFSLKPQV